VFKEFGLEVQDMTLVCLLQDLLLSTTLTTNLSYICMFLWQVDFYIHFQATCPHVYMSLMILSKLKEFNSCCCKYHMQIKEIKFGVNSMRSILAHHGSLTPTCDCSCPKFVQNLQVG
jgi:hypothetical protein